MATFSERYGYTKPSDIIIREEITEEVENAIYNCLEKLRLNIEENYYSPYNYNHIYFSMEEFIWTNFLNMKVKDSRQKNNFYIVSQSYVSGKNPWYEKLNLIEFIIDYVNDVLKNNKISLSFVMNLNKEFERLNFGYRIIDNRIVETTSETEVKTIEKAINNQQGTTKSHLQKAIELYAKRPDPDYQNSIKESISAVEALCREITDESTLGKALSKLESKKIVIHPMLKNSFTLLYGYTNDEKTGIRHSLMDSTETYTPSANEAMLMLVLCSTFINYLEKKRTSLNNI